MIKARSPGKKWADLFPDLGTELIPTARCISDEYFALEREKIFKRVWLNVVRVEEIPEPLNYKLKPLPFAQTSLILIRGELRPRLF